MKSTKASLSIVQIVDEPYGGDMMSTPRTQTYSYHRDLSIPFKAAVERIYLTLKDQGFGVLTEIDLKDKFKEKLNVDFRPYKILGACNPTFAHRALTAAPEVGLLLPCNVTVVQMDDDLIQVSVVDPSVMMSVVPNDSLKQIAQEVRERLQRVLKSLEI